MDMADHCATLPNERINPRFGRAARAIESKNRPVDQPAGRCAQTPARIDHPTAGKHATARIEILAFGTGHPPCHRCALEPGAPNRPLYSHHQRFKFASSQPRASVDTVDDQTYGDLPDLHPHVVFVRVECRSTWRTLSHRLAMSDVSIGWTRRSALRRPSCSTSLSSSTIYSHSRLQEWRRVARHPFDPPHRSSTMLSTAWFGECKESIHFVRCLMFA
jgi:hypothetical protein